MNILALLSVRRFETIENLAANFDVSVRTIKQDIFELSLERYPIYTKPGPHGGVYVMDGWQFGMKFFADEDINLLKKMQAASAGILTEQDKCRLQSILKIFANSRKRN